MDKSKNPRAARRRSMRVSVRRRGGRPASGAGSAAPPPTTVSMRSGRCGRARGRSLGALGRGYNRGGCERLGERLSHTTGFACIAQTDARGRSGGPTIAVGPRGRGAAPGVGGLGSRCSCRTRARQQACLVPGRLLESRVICTALAQQGGWRSGAMQAAVQGHLWPAEALGPRQSPGRFQCWLYQRWVHNRFKCGLYQVGLRKRAVLVPRLRAGVTVPAG